MPGRTVRRAFDAKGEPGAGLTSVARFTENVEYREEGQRAAWAHGKIARSLSRLRRMR